MAAAPPTGASHKVLLSTHEKENFQRIARLLVAGGTAIMREMFDKFFSPHQFVVRINHPDVKSKIKKAKLSKPQLECLYPKLGTCNRTSKDFDISLLYKLFKTVCNLTPPASGWDTFPPPTDHSTAADLTRIKEYRNKICHGYPEMEMGDTEFNSLWNDIQEALVRLAGSISHSAQSAWERLIEKLLTDPLTPEDERNVRELKEWYENEVGTKEEIKKVGKSIQVGLEGVHQAIKRTGDDVHQAIKRTGDDVQKRIDDVQQAIKETGETIMKKIHPIVAKKNDPRTSAQLTKSALVGRAQNNDFQDERKSHLQRGSSTPPEKMLTATSTQSEFIKANFPQNTCITRLIFECSS